MDKIKEENKKLLYIPQGCYGLIGEDTPQNTIGLYTQGIVTCSGIICNDDTNSAYR